MLLECEKVFIEALGIYLSTLWQAFGNDVYFVALLEDTIVTVKRCEINLAAQTVTKRVS